MFKIVKRFRLQASGFRLPPIITLWFVACSLQLAACSSVFAQEPDLEFTLDVTANTIPTPKIFKPNIDLSGRGFSRQATWPQGLAASEVLNNWQKDIGFAGLYRLQYNLWEISQFKSDKDSQDSLLGNYENIIKNISDAGGIVILDIFGTPAGLGKVLDKTSPFLDLKAFKAQVKSHIQKLSCQKRYNIWYEVWNAPDLDGFFLGRKQEYLNLYRALGQAISELESEYKIHIPLGGPGVSWWFQNLDGNTIITPERSLIYELIKFSYRYHLPLDFITWHGYSTDPKAEKEITAYNETAIVLIRDWLSYFHFDRNTPLIVDEWNYDRTANILPERKERSYICASYIPGRLKNMYEVGLDYQLYFSLEDFQHNRDGVVRNTGIFWFDPEFSEYKGGPKSIYNVFRMLALLGDSMFQPAAKLEDEFVGVIATKGKEQLAILIYNYIDPEIALSFLSKNITRLNGTERKTLLSLIKSNRFEKVVRRELDISTLRPTPVIVTIFGPLLKPFSGLISSTNKLRTLLKKAQELNAQAMKFKDSSRNIKIGIKNLKENYFYFRYALDSSCSSECQFVPVEEKEVNASDLYQETLRLNPYSVNLIILKKKPPEPESTAAITIEQSTTQNVENSAEIKKE